MIKLFIKLSIVFFLMLANFAQATLMHVDGDTLSSNEYIVYNYNGIDYDITWASNVNSQRRYVKGLNFNTLLSPTTHTGWDFAGEAGIPSINDIFGALTGEQLLSQFTNKNDGSFIHSFSHWNTLFTEPKTNTVGGAVVGAINLIELNIQSQWSWSVPSDDEIDTDTQKMEQHFEILSASGSGDATFYVRPSQVPEPSTLLIFSLGLIALVTKKKLLK